MGAKLKVCAVLVGLMLIPLGAWLISLLLFAYAASGLFLRGLRRGRKSGVAAEVAPYPQVGPTTAATKFKGSLGSPVRVTAGVVMVLLSIVAFAEGGTYSPLVFGSIGTLILLWRSPIGRLWNAGRLRPVEESILLKRAFDPIHWFAIAEVKLATKQLGRALSGINETLIVTTGKESPSILVVLETASLTSRKAEEALTERFGELARVSAPLGAYILPVDSGRAEELLRFSVEPAKLDSKGWPYSLSTTDYDILSIESRKGLAHSVGAYKKTSDASRGKAALLPSRQVFSRPPLLWEVLQELGKKAQWPTPDAYTAFLASMFATRGETIGERVVETATSGNSQTVVVKSLSTSSVQLSRAQLRAIAKIYC